MAGAVPPPRPPPGAPPAAEPPSLNFIPMGMAGYQVRTSWLGLLLLRRAVLCTCTAALPCRMLTCFYFKGWQDTARA
jgi:hypothetical protein